MRALWPLWAVIIGGLALGCEATEVTVHQPPAPDAQLERWVEMWNSYDLDEVNELFLDDPGLTYFSSEKEGVIRGMEAVLEHHRGFGFVPGGGSKRHPSMAGGVEHRPPRRSGGGDRPLVLPVGGGASGRPAKGPCNLRFRLGFRSLAVRPYELFRVPFPGLALTGKGRPPKPSSGNSTLHTRAEDRTMPSRFLTCLLVFFPFLSLQGQESPEASFEKARADWDAGRFVEALGVLEGLLVDNPEAELQDRIATLTGELFKVTELAADGRAVRWSPDGRYGAYESGTGPQLTTHVFKAEGGGVAEVGSLSGTGTVFSPSGGRAAYLKVDETPSLAEARAAVEAEFGGTDRASRMQLRSALARLEAEHTVIVVRELESGEERLIRPEDLSVSSLFFGQDDGVYFLGGSAGEGGSENVFRVQEDGSASSVAEVPGPMADPFFTADGSFLVYGSGRGSFGIRNMATGEVESYQGSFPVGSKDGKTLAFLSTSGELGAVNVLALRPGGVSLEFSAAAEFPVSTSSTRACPSCPLQSGLALSDDGNLAVVQGRPREDWELFLVQTAGSGAEAAFTQVTREIQHDLFPTFLPDGRVLAMKGEGRHRRSYLYDFESGDKIWLFRNNTTRTVAPEYEWAPSPDGSKLLIVAERDGNTVSPERGVYLLDLTRKLTREEILARVRRNLEAERELRARAESMYSPLRKKIQAAVDQISMTRLFEYQEALFQFGSKNVSQPGNRAAIDYIAGKLREFGYEPELQWFDARGERSANVIARIPGAVSPDVVYAVSAHFDSNNSSPGADDNTSATVGLMEMARVLAGLDLPATVEVAFFTGEESGLLGSREYVRQAVESGKKLVGALNNDMVGFAEDHRLDNTIRYSNAGIRDLQHGAAMLFSDMVTHDAEYYKSTDAAAYFDAYGDIVGGIGSYPILASPHYHQSHDVLETINHKLVTEVAKTTTASVMLLASIPSRVGGLKAMGDGSSIAVSWDPAVEADVTGYRVAFGPEEDPLRFLHDVTDTSATLEGGEEGWVISVKAVNERGMEGWDWARILSGG